MSEETTQAVVDETNTPPVAGSAVDNARNDGPDLESLLAEFSQETKPADPPSPQTVTDTTPPDVKALAAQVQSLQGVVNEVQQFKFQRDFGELVKDVRGDLDPDVFDDELIGAWVDAAARKDPRLQRAWLEREARPKQFRAIAGELGRSFKKKFDKLPDRNVTEDREAVTAAIRGASTKAPEDTPPNFSRMSNAEARKEIREKYGFDPGF